MEAKRSSPMNIDDYIAQCPQEIQDRLQTLRRTIHEAAPGAEEAISYKMPAFKLKGNLVYFAAFPHHIGFYPIPAGVEKFKKELSVYKQGKGSVQFPNDQPLPLALVRKIVAFRVKDNLAKAAAKGKVKRAASTRQAARK
jgi:uncharacterized protein YdhG (YjbR/CyaY superfamily)